MLFVGYLLCSIATNIGLVMFGQGVLGGEKSSHIFKKFGIYLFISKRT